MDRNTMKKDNFSKVSLGKERKFHIPKFFNILGQVWNVIIDKTSSKTIGGGEAGGSCNYDGTMTIDPECASHDLKAKRVLVHEFIHAVLFRCELDALITEEMNEQITSQLTIAILENWDVLPKKYLGSQRLLRQKKQP